MKILKASAGSGKTFRLSHQYIDLLLSSGDRYAYRHILAVTFTNKATAEMKSRILRDLNAMASENARAREMLVDILHDYSAFSVCTIDKFFQQALKSFSREIGHMADYQIELDRDSLICEAMDRILDSLTEDDSEVLNWIRHSVAEQLESGKKYGLEAGLYEMGKFLKSEDHRRLSEQCGTDDSEQYSKERLVALREECRSIIRDFEGRALDLGIAWEKGKRIARPGVKAMKELPPEAEDLFDEPYRLYCTAWIVRESIFSLGLAEEFYREFDAILKEKNIMCLDESNTILRKIIDGSDAPFVYEKLGVRYNNFLLDEFQDTSSIQWENFLPLLRESESSGGQNLIVGDIKQSIYRWRDSDWKLLGSEVAKEFPADPPETLKCNWRSSQVVVDFNNRFFEYASRFFHLEDIYDDVVQIPKKEDDQRGQVRMSFCEDQLAAVYKSVKSAIHHGAGYGDIAILVRGNAEGGDLAAYLLENGIPVISDDSLKLKSSVTVKRLVSLLGLMENPKNRINSFMAQEMGIEVPDRYHSLVDLCEGLLRDICNYDTKTFSGETLFIEAFMDNLQNWSSTNGNNLHYFLKYWEENNFAIGCPDDSNAVRVITVHKSKGLEFPYVIFPFAEKVELYRHGVRWCSLDKGTELDGLYPVSLTKASADSLFDKDYDEEQRMQLVDNINILYVALTRAQKSLHIIAREPSKAFRTSLKKTPKPGNFSELLYAFGGAEDEYVFGEPYDFAKMEREQKEVLVDFPASYPSIPLGDRLMPSADASDFFGDDGSVGIEASARLKGKLLHDILSKVDKVEDLEHAVDSAVKAGTLQIGQRQDVMDLLSERIGSRKEWFCGGGLNELVMFDSSGREKRPDRVIVRDGAVTVIDYKFAKKDPAYERQVRGYMNMFRQMGYPEVRGYLWFVREDEVSELI